VLSDEAIALLVQHSQGDARRALNTLEATLKHVHASSFPRPVSPDVVRQVLEKPLPTYDKAGEQHYNLISALQKSVRGSDVNGALYWLARMLAGGEDPLYLARRLVRMAIEDVGLADPRALSVALAAKDAYHFLGTPEGELALAEATIYLATAPKSNSAYTAFGDAQAAAEEHPAEPVPLHIRQAPTPLLKELGYGKGYKYAFDSKDAYLPQEYLPESLRGAQWYQPSDFGYEKTVRERLEWWEKLKRGEGSGPAAP
jgi:putative ATPase